MRWLRRGDGPRTARGRGAWLGFLAAFWPFILGALLVAGGIAAIVLGYLGVAGTLAVGLQLPYLVSGGLLGIALVVLGTGLLVLHAMNRQARLTKRLLDEMRAETSQPSVARREEPSTDGVVVAVRGGRWFHRPSCLLVSGKDVRRMKAGSQSARRLSPCRVCDPPTAAA